MWSSMFVCLLFIRSFISLNKFGVEDIKEMEKEIDMKLRHIKKAEADLDIL